MKLPPRIRELVGLIGIEAVMQLLTARMLGREWRISPTRESEFYRAWSDVIGEGLTDVVIKAWSGRDSIYLANCAELLREERHNALRAEYDRLITEGLSSRNAIHQLCQKTGISDRWLRSILNRPPPPPSPEDRQLLLDFLHPQP
jgi:hypothetical protein